MSRRRPHRRTFLTVPRLCAGSVGLLLLLAVLARGSLSTWAAAPDEQALRAAWQRAQSQPGYRFSSNIDQTVLPIASAATIGRTDTRVSMVAEGAVRAPDQAEVRIAVDGQPASAAMGIVQYGARSFVRQGDKLMPVESPAGAAAPTGDYLAFLAGAANVREIEPTSAAGHSFRRYAFDLDGQRLAEHLQREMEGQLKGTLPAGIRVSPAPLVAQMTGGGTLWVDEAGLPRRQIMDLTLPRASADYGARIHVDTEFRDFGQVASIGTVTQDAAGTWHLTALAAGASSAAVSGTIAQSSDWSDRSDRSDRAAQYTPSQAPATTLTHRTLAVAQTWLADGLLLVLALLLGAGLSFVVLSYRRRRSVYVSVVAVTLAAMIGGPLLQALRISDFVASHASAAAGFGATTALAQAPDSDQPPAPAPAPAAGTLPRGLAQAGAGSSIAACGQGSTTTDTDTDGLSDFEEGCRGTDPYREDSDEDLIPDRDEVTGFTVGGQTWYGNPIGVDASGDGLVDSAEWPTPVGKGPRIDANGDGTTTDEEAWDPDGDGVPNIWDADNDGDGVPDDSDLSPFSRTALLEEYTLNTQGGGTDGYQYIELQVVPENPDHLRYNVSALDWPADDKGQMADLDNSAADVRLFPMLEVLTNVRPDPELARKYGVGTVESVPGSSDPLRIYAPLLPVTDNGRVTAFYTRVGYPPAQQSQIRWQAKLVWVVQGDSDNDDFGEIHTDSVPLQTYAEPSFSVAGAVVSRSQGFESAFFATPDTPDDDRQLFNLLFGLNAAFASADGLSLGDVVNRFTQPLTPPEEKWGVTANVVTDRVLYDHQDAGVSDTSGRRLPQFLSAHFASSDTPAVIAAFEARSRTYDQDQVGRLDPGATLNVNLADAPLVRTRGLQLNLYQAAGSDWRTLTSEQRQVVLDLRYADVSGSLAALQPTYPELTAVDLQSVVRTIYDIWATGRTSVVTADELTLTAPAPADGDLTARLARDASLTLDAYALDVAKLGQPGGGLRVGGGHADDWQYIRGNLVEAKIVGVSVAGFQLYEFGSAPTPQGQFAKKALKVVTAAKDLYQLYKATQVFNALTRSQQILNPLTKGVLTGRSMGAIGTVVAVGLIWVTFGLTTDFSNPIAVKLAVATAVVATVFTVLMFAISLNPVGLVLTALFYLVDLIVFFATSGDVSISDIIIGAIAAFFYDVNVLTEIEEANLADVESGLFSPEYGLRQGNIFSMTSEVTGKIRKTSDGDLGDLQDSYVTGRFDGSTTLSELVPLNGEARCRLADSATLNCHTYVGSAFYFKDASRDVDMSVQAWVNTKVYYDECTFQGLYCSRDSLTNTFPEGDNEPSEVVLDVVPWSLDALWAWDAAPVVAGHVFNPDLDGDARPDRDELPTAPCTDPGAQQCTDSDDWDTDGDGVPDGYEVTNAGALGVNAALADTDGDGLMDGEELRVGSNPADADTDADGLRDGEEVFQPGDSHWQPGTLSTTVGGWLMRLPGGGVVPVVSDPRSADADGDGVNDAAERANQTSPYAVNRGPVLVLGASPLPPTPARRQGLYVAPGTAISLRLDLYSVGQFPIDEPLELCLPGLLSGLAGGDLSGDSSLKPVTTVGCGGDAAARKYRWAFSATDSLPLGSAATTTITGIAGSGATTTQSGLIAATLPYRDGLDRDGNGTADPAELAPSVPVTVDVDDPEVAFSLPLDGAILGGGTTSLVIGGTASDAGSWVTAVNLSLPGGGTATATEISPWSYSWALPADGVHVLSVGSVDATGRTSTPASVSVTVDNTAPSATFSSPADGAFITDPTGEGAAVTVTGAVTDNLSGIQRLQVQVDDRAWVPVALTGGNRPDFPTSANWQYDWRLPGGDAAQGRHTVRVRAYDRANNLSVEVERAIIVDVLPPADGLTNGRFESDPPSYRAGQPVDLQGLANDAGNAPLAPRPAALAGTLDSLDDATVWLSPATVDEDDAGVSVTWLGDFNGDRLADLALGLPAAADGAGRIAIVYGRPGGFALPPTPELIADSPTTYVGEAGAAIGANVSGVGDMNGDGLDDMLVGDPAKSRAHLVFGRRSVSVPDAVLDGTGGAERSVLNGPAMDGQVAAAGDVNGDGLGDMLVSAQSAWQLMLGKELTSWQPAEDVTIQAAGVVAISPGVAPASGVGDMDGDGRGEFVVADPSGLLGAGGNFYLYRGSATFAAASRQALVAATAFPSSASTGRIAALGDMNGDGRADFAYHDGAAPKIVFGSAGGNGSCCLSLGGYAPAASGFLAAVGNVDADAGNRRDLLVGAADGSAYLLVGAAGLAAGSPAPGITARLTDVAGAATLAPLAGADANADGSADLVVVPGSAGAEVLATSQLLFGRVPHVATDALPRGRTGTGGSAAPMLRRSTLGPLGLTATNRYVDDDWAGTAAGADPDGGGPATNFGVNSFATIQAAVNGAGAGDSIFVGPGVYPGFEVTGAGKNDLAIVGDDPDAVFVNGATIAGASVAAYIHDVTGVSLASLTLRNADRGVWLLRAGAGGYTSPITGMGDPALRIELSRVLVQDCAFGLYSDRLSAVAVADSTIAARGAGDRHVQVDPTTPDPALNPAWSTNPPADLPAGKPAGAGGSVYTQFNRPRVMLGGGSREVYAYDDLSDSWSTRPGPPLDVVAGSATTVDRSDELLYLLGQQYRFAGIPGLTGTVEPTSRVGAYTLTPSGTNLYAAGTFVNAGGVVVNHVARYDTTTGAWSALGGGLRNTCQIGMGAPFPCDPIVNASVVDSSGNLYIGGSFDAVVNPGGGTVAVNGIAMWNGSAWSALGSGVQYADNSRGDIRVLTANGSDIYVGGNFDKAGGITVNSIARWNGSAWSALGAGVRRPDPSGGTRTGFVWAINIQGSNIYIGGNFDSTPTDHITRWDGSAYQAVGPVVSPLAYIVGISFLGSTLYVSDRDSLSGAPHAIRQLSGASWLDITPSGLGVTVEGDLVTNAGKFYVLPEFYTDPNVAVYDGANWSLMAGSPMANDQVWDLAFIGTDIYVGGNFSSVNNEDMAALAANRIVRYSNTPRLVRYPSTPTWEARANPPRLPAAGSSLAADGAGSVYATFGGVTQFSRYNITANTWTTMAAVPVATTTGAASAWAGGNLYLLSGDSVVNSSAAFYRFTPNGGTGAWTALASAPFDLGAGADLEWIGGDEIYAVQGGNGRTFARYSIAANAWVVLGTGGSGLSTPGGSNAGSGLSLFGTDLYFARGGGTAVDRFGPVGVQPEKLTLDRVAFVTPENTAAQTWLNTDLLTGGREPADYLLGGSGSQWVAGATTWTPSGASAPLPMSFVTTTAAKFLDAAGGVFRVAQGGALTAGYAEPHPDAHVYTSLAACAPCALPVGNPDRLVWGSDAFDSVQAAIDTGAARVLVHAGAYAQAFHLVTGVQVLGAGANLSVISPPAGAVAAVARAEGLRGSKLARLTLAGSPGVDGVRVEDGARDVTLARSVLRDAGTGLRIQGASTDVEVVNNTLVRNGSGLVAESCAPVDVRNTIFANHTVAGLAYQACAASKLHTYNDYFGNTADLKIDGAAVQQPGTGEIFADPAFTQPAAPTNDFRPTDGSPVIDAGNPSDPVPPGVGGRVDIGYVEVNGAAFFADDDYCEFCDNDGLFWQVDAFDVVGDALSAAGNEIAALGCGIASVGGVPCDTQWTVGVGPGSYAERLTVPSHVSLIGTGADAVTIDAGGSSSPVRVQGAISVEVRGLTLTGSSGGGGGVVVDGASSGVRISRNLVLGNAGQGLWFAGRSTGEATFNTVVGNGGAGYVAAGAGTWFSARSSIVSGNATGLQTLFAGQVFDDYNLVHGNTTDYQDSAGTGLVAGPGSILGQAPGFVGGGDYSLTPASPAVDSADPLAEVPVGGGVRADMGYQELVGVPLGLFLGKEGISAATGNSGIQSVEVGFRRITDPSLPITDTLSVPTSWQTTTLATPNQTASYWTRTLTPASGDGLYRVYSRALDRAGNRVDDATAQYRGAFTFDTALPVVTWLGPAGGSTTTSPVELRAQVADYVAGEFNVADIRFEVDGLPVAAEWAPEPWDPTSGAPRVFRAWVPLATGPHTGLRAVAIDRAGNQGVSSPNLTLTISGASPADATPPTVVVSAPADGATVRSAMTFSGTVADTGGSGVAGVQVSLDGGQVWTPATITGGNWTLAWTGPADREYISYPVRVRALDRAGNVSSLTALSVTIDNVAPAGVAPVVFDLPEGSHVDQFTNLTIGWEPPLTGSGVASVLLAVDQVPDTRPLALVTGQTAVRQLDALGDWYVHIATADALGNTLARHFGPWHVGTVEETTVFAALGLDGLLGKTAVACADRRQSIVLDGVLDVALDEWRNDTELLATDERSGVGQSLYFTWDGVNSYLGWQGARWTLDGTMFAYFDTAAGGTTTPLATTPGGTPLSLPALPFAADYAVAVDSPTVGGLWRWNGSVWAPESLPASDFAFVHGEMAGTEVRLPWGAPELALPLKLLAFAVDESGSPSSVFPTANASTGPWTTHYSWADRCNTDPSSGIPRARLATLALNSPESALAPWGHDNELHYVVTVNNPEGDPLTGAQVQLSTTPGLGYRSLAGTGGSCGSCPVGGATWTLNIPPVPARGSAEFTVTGRLASVLTGLDAVTTTARLSLPITPSGASVLEQQFSHRVDSRQPTAGVMVPAGTIGLAGLDVLGEANDGAGIGVDFVEVRVNGGPWQLVSGTALWTKNIVPPSGATSLTLEVRATDFYGLQSAIASETLVVDGVPPTILSFVVPPVIIGDIVELGGTAADSFPAGGELLRVEVQIDDPSGPWLPAILNTATGTVSWHFTWDVPPDFGSVHQLRARAVDAAGNAGPATAWQRTTTFPTSPVDAGPDQRWPAGLPVQFAGTFIPWGGSAPYGILWNFGDGTTQAGTVTDPTDPALTPTHQYARAGTYRVTLSVTHDGTALLAAVAPNAADAAAAPTQGGGVTVSDGLVVELLGGDPTAAEITSFDARTVGQRVALSWTTGAEAGIIGFHIVRAPSVDGPWTSVNPTPIPAQGSAATGRRYELVDSPGAGTHHYRLEVLHDRGAPTWHGPVTAAVVAGDERVGAVWLPWLGRR